MEIPKYLRSNIHPVTITVIGAGGNGSQLLNQLGRINHALIQLGYAGIHVNCFDDDVVSDSNIGRQLFSSSEIGANKAVVLISKLNRFFGTHWNAYSTRISVNEELIKNFYSNIIITCTDNKKSRLDVEQLIIDAADWKMYDEHEIFYWLDIGNKKDYGQVILGSPVEKYKLPTILDLFPSYRTDEEDTSTPSCSLAEALQHQNLFVNTFVTNVAAELIWELLSQNEINWHGAFVNVETLNIKKLKC